VVGAGAEAEGEACELIGFRPGEGVNGVEDFFLPWSWGMVVRMMNRTKMTEMMVRPKARIERPCGEVKRSSMVSSPPSSVWLASDALRGVASVARGMVVSRSSPVRLSLEGDLLWYSVGLVVGCERGGRGRCRGDCRRERLARLCGVTHELW